MKIFLPMLLTILFVLIPVALMASTDQVAQDTTSGFATGTFAGGCFWCTESDFEKLDGVIRVISGYTGGAVATPRINRSLREPQVMWKPFRWSMTRPRSRTPFLWTGSGGT